MIIKIEQIDEVYLRFYSEPSIEQELSDFFTYEYPGARFTPAFRAKLWDGKVRLADINRKTLYVGLLNYVYTFAERNGYTIKLLSPVHVTNNINYQQIEEFTKQLNPYGRGEPIVIRDYQIEAITEALDKNRVLLLSPTASGKSFIIYSIMRWHLEHKRKCIIIVPTTSLVEQLYTDYSSENKFDVQNYCQKLYSGFTKEIEKDVMISTWQSIHKQPKSWFSQFDVVFGDEAHQFKASSLSATMGKMTNVKYRIGTTGTIDNHKCHKLVLEGMFGPIYKVTTTKQLMETKTLAELKIICLVLQYDEITRRARKNNQYQDEMEFLVSQDKRNKFIANLALKQNGNTLVLFQYINHGKDILKLVKDILENTSRKLFYVSGEVNAEGREFIRKECENENNAIIVASFGTFSTGVNIPSIENIIFASPYKSRIRNLQSIGRGLRKKDGKNVCTLYDIADDLSWKSWKNHTLRHLAERIKTYSEEKFNFKIIKLDI